MEANKQMNKLGLIGGTSWHSTVEYYAMLNQAVNDYYGDNTNPPLRLINLNQKQIHDLQRSNDWGTIADIFVEAALELQRVGVDGISLCANTPHKVYDQIQASLSIPILHIADAMGEHLRSEGYDTVGLIGTRFTMAQDFIKGRLLEQYQIKTIVPPTTEQNVIQEMLYNKLSMGVFDDQTKKFFVEAIESLAERGAQAVILGCTEFPLLLKDTRCAIPLIDSLKCHSEALIQYTIDEDE